MKLLSKIDYNKKNKISIILFSLNVLCICLVGLLFLYSASSYSAKSTYNDELFFVKKQIIGIILGFIFFIFFTFFDYNKIKKFNIILVFLTIILLSLVFVSGVGVEKYGAKRWISFGSITIQPSEVAKFSLILFSASIYSNTKLKLFQKIIPIIIYGFIICLLIILEPNMSITICVVALLFSIIFLSEIKFKYILLFIIPIIILAFLLIIIEPYRLKRLLAFLNPWQNPKGEGYQLLQSLYALGSGGLFGVGLFNSRQKYAFLPFAESDFILSIIGEEIGFVGVFFFFLLYVFLIVFGLKTFLNAKNIFGAYLSFGITMIITIQTIINALVVSGSIPPTGLPLPLISSGNTSIIIFLSELGILANIKKQSL